MTDNPTYDRAISLRLEALRLAHSTDESRGDVLLRAELYERFLTGNVTISRVNQRPVTLVVNTDPSVIDEAAKAVKRATERMNAGGVIPKEAALAEGRRRSRAVRSQARVLQRDAALRNDKADVLDQFTTTIHEAGIFADPVILTEKIGQALQDAKLVGE